jgi:hypothetical protein
VELIRDALGAAGQSGRDHAEPAPKRHGVIFSDADAPAGDDAEGPVRKLRRWLGYA